MHISIRYKLFITACLTITAICSCSEDNKITPDETAGIVINKSELVLRAGQSDTTLFATIYPASDATDYDIVWNSDNESVATVDMHTGVITAISVGTAGISASTSDGELSDTCAVTVRPPVSVYAVGTCGSNQAAVWHDGEMTLLPAGDITTADAVYLHGEDLFVAGHIWNDNRWDACVWKNGENTVYGYSGFPSFINDIHVSEAGQVLACGYSSADGVVPVLWIDGLAQQLPCESSYSEATALIEDDGVVYVTGYDYNTEYEMGIYGNGILWINGARTEISDGVEDFVECTDMEILNGIVYMCGTRTLSSGAAEKPILYVDGEIRELPSYGSNTYATALCLHEGDIYVSGYVDVSVLDENGDTVPRYIAVYWKNDEMIALTDGTTSAMALSIEVRDSDVYVGGHDSDISDTPYTRAYATIWKNGEVILNDRSAPGSVTDMALTE